VPNVGGVTVGSDLANSTAPVLGKSDLIVPNVGDLFELQMNTAVSNPSATVNAITGTIAPAILGGVGSAVASGVGVVFSTVGSFLVDFVTGLISSAGNFKNTHLLALVVGLVVVVVMFR
jgi:phage tail tape-measure protein